MFDPDALLVGEGNVPPAGELSELIVDTHRSLVAREGELVVLAGLWADAHDHVDDPLPRSEPGRRGRGAGVRCYGGGGGPGGGGGCAPPAGGGGAGPAPGGGGGGGGGG